jgi:hypothetical protein
MMVVVAVVVCRITTSDGRWQLSSSRLPRGAMRNRVGQVAVAEQELFRRYVTEQVQIGEAKMLPTSCDSE